MRGPDRPPRFIALCRDVVAPAARPDAMARAIAARWPNLSRDEPLPGVELFCRPEPRLRIQVNRSGSLLVIGQLFERGPGRNARSLSADVTDLAGEPDSIARTLIDEHWGSYLAIIRDTATNTLFVLRDPSGAVPASIIDNETVAVVAEQIPRWLHQAVAGPPRIAWDLIAAQLNDPSVAGHHSFLRAVRPVVAGCLCPIARDTAPQRIWNPIEVAGRATPSNDRLAAQLHFTVGDSVAALTAGHERLLLELSGGLDSAILLGCLAERFDASMIACVNSATANPGGDERRYARAAADRYGVMLTEAVLDAGEMDYTQLADQSAWSEPLLYGSDVSHERLVSAMADATGASLIVTGQGGDAVFFQDPTPLVAADHLRASGLNRATWRTMLDSAHRSHGNIWSVLRAARRARHGHRFDQLVEHDNLLLGPAARRPTALAPHPWLVDIDRLAPAKRVQLQLLAVCQFFRGPTARSDHAVLIHPLLAQPVVELCLAIPSWRLAFGKLDRGLAREAFAAQLPDIIARRRGKGQVSSYYSHAILANLPFLRELLLDGLLCRHDLLDRDMLDRALSEASLVHRPDHRVIIAYASLEAWLRSWS